MEEKPNYYAIIPAEVRYNENLRANEKLLFGEITALSNTTGICTASNNYFAKLYNVVPSAITKWIKDLEKYRYIDVEYIKKGKEIKQRIIKITGIHKYDEVFTNVIGGYSQKVKENITSINNTSIKENIKRKVLKKPTLEEVKAYCEERNNNVDAQRFIDFYEANNWTDSKGNKVKSWKQKVITWESHQDNNVKKQEELPSWWNLTNKDFEEENDEFKRKAEAIRNGTYKP